MFPWKGLHNREQNNLCTFEGGDIRNFSLKDNALEGPKNNLEKKWAWRK